MAQIDGAGSIEVEVETVEAEFVNTEIIQEELDSSIEGIDSVSELMEEYNALKREDATATKEFTSGKSLKGMHEINEIVAEKMLEIDSFANNGDEQGFFGRTTSKALAIVDSNNSWVGKWMNNASEKSKAEDRKNQSINEIVSEVKGLIEGQRTEIITAIDKLITKKDQMIERRKYYAAIHKKAEKYLETCTNNIKEEMDTKMLINNIVASIIQSEKSIKSHAEPLIASARLSVENVQNMLPTIEDRLLDSLDYKGFQQKLSDFNSMTKALVDMSTMVSDKLDTEINNTAVQSIEMLSELGIDTKKLSKSADTQLMHQKKINDAMTKTVQKINKSYSDVTEVQHKIASNREKLNNNLISNYSKAYKPSDD